MVLLIFWNRIDRPKDAVRTTLCSVNDKVRATCCPAVVLLTLLVVLMLVIDDVHRSETRRSMIIHECDKTVLKIPRVDEGCRYETPR